MNLCTCEKPVIRNDRCMKCLKFRIEEKKIAEHYPLKRDCIKQKLMKRRD
jgi:hypothetical protein